MLKFKYGINPYDNASLVFGNGLNIEAKNEISLNAFLDIIVGIMAAKQSGHDIVYTKHAIPIFGFAFNNANELNKKIIRAQYINQDYEFGAFCFRKEISLDTIEAIGEYRFHTIAAKYIKSDAMEYIISESFQEHNRCVTAVQYGDYEKLIPNNIYMKIGLGNTSINTSIGKNMLPSRFSYLNYIRTIGTIAIDKRSGDLLTSTACELSPTNALKTILNRIDNDLIDENSVEIATDACYGVENPNFIAKNKSISKLVLFGKKNIESKHCKQWNERIELQIFKDRAFTYFL